MIGFLPWTSAHSLIHIRQTFCCHSKLKLFGKDLLTRDIRQSDLTEEDLKLVNSGDYQLLSKRDHCNRSIWIGAPKMMREHYMSCKTDSEREASLLSRVSSAQVSPKDC